MAAFLEGDAEDEVLTCVFLASSIRVSINAPVYVGGNIATDADVVAPAYIYILQRPSTSTRGIIIIII